MLGINWISHQQRNATHQGHTLNAYRYRQDTINRKKGQQHLRTSPDSFFVFKYGRCHASVDAIAQTPSQTPIRCFAGRPHIARSVRPQPTAEPQKTPDADV
jgi:hypothetical protein